MERERHVPRGMPRATLARTPAQPRAIPWSLLSYLLLGILALFPRVLDLGDFVTEDEIHFWIARSGAFLWALQTGDFAATAISDHPGVTTMWLGSAGILLREGLTELGLVRADRFPTMLALMRLPVALTHTAGILFGYGLLRRLLPVATAFLAALFWAVDPFVVAYSQLLHVDGLATTFATLSLLAACHFWNHTRHPASLGLSAIWAALAVLSKSPALVLLPAVAALALVAAWNGRDTVRPWRRGAISYLLWLAICGLAIFVIWPALWTSPFEAYTRIHLGVVGQGAQPHELGNFFLSRRDDAPGLLFYPTALALRLTPWALAGLLLLGCAWLRSTPATRHDLAVLAAFVVLFTVALSIFPKKFNRYILPAFPALDILAAAGLVWGFEWMGGLLASLVPRAGARRAQGAGALVAVTALLAVFNIAWWRPYPIAYGNQALGGAHAIARTFMVGWGEGLEQVAAWLNRQPDITGVVTLSTMVSALEPYLREGAQVVGPEGNGLPDKTGYVVIYKQQAQMGALPPPFDHFYRDAVPVETIRIHGVDYAWIYHAPPPMAFPRSATFGDTITLLGFDLVQPLRRGGPLVVRLVWHARSRPAADYMLFAHLIGPDRIRSAQVDLPYPTSGWRPERYERTEVPLQMPADAPAGDYRLVLGLYDLASGQRLPLQATDPVDPTLDGPDALVLAELQLE